MTWPKRRRTWRPSTSWRVTCSGIGSATDTTNTFASCRRMWRNWNLNATSMTSSSPTGCSCTSTTTKSDRWRCGCSAGSKRAESSSSESRVSIHQVRKNCTTLPRAHSSANLVDRRIGGKSRRFEKVEPDRARWRIIFLKNQFIEKVQHFLIDVIVDRFLNLFKWVKWNGNVNMRRSGVDLVVEFYLLAPVPNLTQYVRNEKMTLMKLITRRTWPWGKRGPMVPPFSDWLCLRCYVTASRRQVKRCSLVKSHSTPSMGCLKSWEI